MKKVFKYRIYANRLTLSKTEQWLETCRFLYNLALEQRIKAYKYHRRSISKFEQMRQVTELRHSFPEYQEIYADVLQNVIKRLDKSYQFFFSRKNGFPRFKKPERYNSLTFRKNGGGWTIKGKYIVVPRLGKFKIKLSRPIEGEIKEVIIARKPTGQWFVSFVCDGVKPTILRKNKKEIGIDMGCESFLTQSDGVKMENPRFFKKSQDVLAYHQQRLSIKAKGSNRRKKAKILVAKKYEKIANQRRDFHYKTASKLIKKYGTIYIEKLNGWTTEWRSLNRSMRDVAWINFISILKVKAESAGRTIIEVDPHNTSQTCSQCGERVKKDLSCRVHSCSCGLVLSRDTNSAINILNLGQRLRCHSIQN